MKVLVDTSIWSLALRKITLTRRESKVVDELKELIHELRVVLLGPIRQELLCGIADKHKFNALRDKLIVFEDLEISREDYEKAAEFFNLCRRKGIQGSHIDFLICAVAVNRRLSIFTTDKDFYNFKDVLDIELHKIRVIGGGNST